MAGEDALANCSIELTDEGQIQGTSHNGLCSEWLLMLAAGHVRIRAKTQGIALSLGDKITISQKTLKA